MYSDGQPRPGVYFGTTGGEVWASTDVCESWRRLAARLAEIFAIGATLH
jgi:hypothetical protein